MSDTTWRDVAENESPEIRELRDLALRDLPAFDKVVGTQFGDIIARHQVAVTPHGWLLFDAVPDGAVILDNLPFPQAVRLFIFNLKTPRPTAADMSMDDINASIRRLGEG